MGNFLKYFSILALLSITLVFYQNCGSTESSSADSSSNAGFNTSSFESLVAYEDNLHQMLTTNCSSCHRSQAQPQFAVDDVQTAHDLLINQNLVNLGSPIDSRLAVVVAGGHETVPALFKDYIANAVESWADDLRRSGSTDDDDSGGGPVEEPTVEPTFSSINRYILRPKCLKCHSPSGIRPREDYSSYSSTIATGGVNRGNANSSRLYLTCLDGGMPDDSAPLNTNQLNALRDWINDGAPNN